MPTTMTIPSATRHLAKVRQFVSERAGDAGLSESDIDQLRLAVDEAVSNAIKHAYGGRDDGTVAVETLREPDRFVVVVRHAGAPFDPKAYHPMRLAEAVRRRRRGGVGVTLMYRLVDSVEYRQRGAFSEVWLAKNISEENCATDRVS
jgi:serine/threonine-protein kinase RsbW